MMTHSKPNYIALNAFYKCMCQSTSLQWNMLSTNVRVQRVGLCGCVFALEHNRPTDEAFIIINGLHAVLMNYADTIDLFL